jgi:acetyl esterase/lipase
MVFSRYLHLLNENRVSPDRIIFMGDSAGAGLAISLMQLLRDRKQPLPREAVLFSPWVDVTNTTAGMLDVKDPFLNIPNLTYGGEVYAGELGTRHPMVSPIYGDLRGLPKITAFGGAYDSLNLDAEKMADKAAA